MIQNITHMYCSENVFAVLDMIPGLSFQIKNHTYIIIHIYLLPCISSGSTNPTISIYMLSMSVCNLLLAPCIPCFEARQS